MKAVDSHTHFKEKFLKVLSKKDINCYLASGVEYAIGVTDFFLIDWKKTISELAILSRDLVKDRYNFSLPVSIIENLLWEEIDYCQKRIDNDGFAEKLYFKLRQNISGLKAFTKHIESLSENVLPISGSKRFIKNLNDEIVASKTIRKKFGLKTYLCMGIHPLAINDIGDFGEIKKVLAFIKKTIKKEKYVIGIGECGLENNTSLEKKVFREVMILARKLNVPVVMHTPLTKGKIPAERKIKGIMDMCKIVKESKINPHNVAFDHITDIECIKVIEKNFKQNRPFISISMQRHWLDPENAALLVKKIIKDWQERILVNSDFGTFQTPEAFSLLKKSLNKIRIPEVQMEKVLFSNANNFFRIKGLD